MTIADTDAALRAADDGCINCLREAEFLTKRAALITDELNKEAQGK